MRAGFIKYSDHVIIAHAIMEIYRLYQQIPFRVDLKDSIDGIRVE